MIRCCTLVGSTHLLALMSSKSRALRKFVCARWARSR